MQIKKYQGGGYNYIPISRVSNAAAASAQGAAASNGSSGSTKVPGFAKEAIDIMKANGLNSDLNKFYQMWQTTLDLAEDPTGETMSMREILKMQRFAATMGNNKKDYDEAAKVLTEQNAWGEMAVTDKGSLYCLRDGELSTISTAEFSKLDDKSNIQLLTNQDIMNMRANGSKLAFDTSGVLNDMQNVKGVDTIVNYLLDTIKKFGTDTQTTYTAKDKKIDAGLKKLLGEGPDGIYKITTKKQLKGDDDILAAVDYLYQTLPQQYKNTLSANTASRGGKPGTADDLVLLINMVQRHTDTTITSDFDKSATDEAAGKKGGAGSGSTSTKTQQLGEAYQTGSGWGAMKNVTLGTSTDGTRLTVKTNFVGEVMKNDDLPLGDANLSDTLLLGKQLSGHLDKNSATFGDIPISGVDMSKIMVDSTKGLQRAWLPVKNENGKEVVDFELYDTIEAIRKSIKPGMTAGQIQQFVQQVPQLTYNTETNDIEIKQAYMKPFMVMSGVVSDDVWDAPLNNSKWVTPLPNSEDKKLKDSYNQTVGTIQSNTDSKAKKTGNKATWFGGYKMYRGAIYIPILEGTQSTALYNGQEYAKTDYMNTDARYAMHAARMEQGMLRDELEANGYQFKLKN